MPALSAAQVVRRLVREARFGALATLDADGGPYASLVAVASDGAGRPGLLISTLARHTQNLARDARASLLFSVGGADPMNSARAGLTGRLVRVEDEAEREALKTRFIARHADAAGYSTFPDFGFYRMEIAGAHLVEGFGRIVDVPGEKLLTDWSGCEDLVESAPGVIAHMNEDHADAVALYASVLAGEAEGTWRMIGVDPEGFEIAGAGRVRRIDFGARAADSTSVRRELVVLAKAARKAGAA